MSSVPTSRWGEQICTFEINLLEDETGEPRYTVAPLCLLNLSFMLLHPIVEFISPILTPTRENISDYFNAVCVLFVLICTRRSAASSLLPSITLRPKYCGNKLTLSPTRPPPCDRPQATRPPSSLQLRLGHIQVLSCSRAAIHR